MLTRYAEGRGFKVEDLGSSPNDGSGFKEVTFAVKGDGAFSVFKFEGGTHRVQRVPETESQGRIHTSTATSRSCPKPRRATSRSTRTTSRSKATARPGPAAQA